jgi:biopolymer transport protein ExbB
MLDIYCQLLAVNTSGAVKNTWDFLLKGGLFMIPLCITSIVGVMAILYKFLSLTKSRVIPDHLADQVMNIEAIISRDKLEPVLATFARGESTLARLCNVAVRHRGKPRQDIAHAVEAVAREEASHLHAGIGVLDIVITVAPLLGLLGTASGLVTIFGGLGSNTDQTTIARGIAIALNTTIFGLTIAVPCVIAHGYFTRRIEVLSARLESLLADLAHVCGNTSGNS